MNTMNRKRLDTFAIDLLCRHYGETVSVEDPEVNVIENEANVNNMFKILCTEYQKELA